MFLVRLIDLVVRVVRHLGTPEARFMRAGLLVVAICGVLVLGAGLIWLLAQIPAHFAAAGPTGR